MSTEQVYHVIVTREDGSWLADVSQITSTTKAAS